MKIISKFLNRYSKKKLFVLSGDIIALFFAIFFLFWFQTKKTELLINELHHHIIEVVIYIFAIFLTINSFRYYNLYKQKIYASPIIQMPFIIKSIALSTIFIITAFYFFHLEGVFTNSRLYILFFPFFSVMVVSINRYLIQLFFIRNEKQNSFFRRRVLAIGAGKVGQNFAKAILRKHSLSIELLGFIDDDITKIGTDVKGFKVIGTTAKLKEIVEELNIEEIFLSIEKITYDRIWELIELVNRLGCQVNLITNYFEVINSKIKNNEYYDLKAVPVYISFGLFYMDFMKRQLDLWLSVILFVLLSPLFLIIALAIKLNSTGGVFYRTSVIGKNGREFIWFKFRTMYENNDQSIHENYLMEIIRNNRAVEKLQNDARITRVGKFLRKYSLDELPQLFNVIMGQMSLIGPRPCLPYEFSELQEWQRRRTSVLPGITGLWQIYGRGRKDVNFNDSIILDLYYIKSISFWFDIQIILRTIPVVLFGIGGK